MTEHEPKCFLREKDLLLRVCGKEISFTKEDYKWEKVTAKLEEAGLPKEIIPKARVTVLHCLEKDSKEDSEGDTKTIKLEQIEFLFDVPEEYNPNCDIIDGHLFFGFGETLKTKDGVEEPDYKPKYEKYNVLVFGTGEIKRFKGKEFEWRKKRYRIKYKLRKEAHQMTKEGIMKFIRMTQNGEKIDSKELYERTKQLIEEYCDFTEEEERKFIPLWIGHTYLTPLFGTTYYVDLQGEPDTGKSTLMRLLSKITPKGVYVEDPSPPVIYRRIATSMPTFFLDEMDKWKEEQKREVIGILNTGYTKEGKVPRCKPNYPDEIEEFETFCPKMFATNKPEEIASFKSRCHTITTMKTNRQLKDINHMSEEDKKRCEEIRSDFYIWALQKGKGILESYRTLKVEGVGKGRDTQLLKIILAVAEHFEIDIKEFLVKERQEQKEKGMEWNREYTLLKVLFELMTKDKACITLNTPKIFYIKSPITTTKTDGTFEEEWGEDEKATNLLMWFRAEFTHLKEDPETRKLLPSARSTGKMLSSGLKLTKNSTRQAKAKYYTITLPEVIDRIKRKGWEQEIAQELPEQYKEAKHLF